MKTYKKVAMVISVIIAMVLTIGLNLISPIMIPSYKGSITSENYQNLKEYAFEIASNSDTKSREDILVTKELTKEALIVNVDASIYGIQAIFPVSNINEKIENGIIKYEGVIDYNNVKYSEHTDVYPPLMTIMMTIIFFVVCTGSLYAIFCIIPNSVSCKRH